MDFGVVDSAEQVASFFEHAQRLFPVMCHFEGWSKPSDIDFDRLENGWSDDNPGVQAWVALEGEVCRSIDMAAAAITATGVNLDDLGENVLCLNRGDLLRYMRNCTRKDIAERKFEEVFGGALKAETTNR